MFGADFGLALIDAVAFEQRAEVILAVFLRGAVAEAEGIVEEAVGIKAGGEAVGAVLRQFAAHDRDHDRRGHAGNAGNTGGGGVGVDLAQGIRVDGDVAGGSLEEVVIADGGQSAGVQHADDRRDAHRGSAAAGDGAGDGVGGDGILRADGDGVGDDARAIAGGGMRLLLGDDDIDRAGHARSAADGDTRRVGGDKLLGVGVHGKVAVGGDGGAFADHGAGRAFIIGNDCHGGHCGRAAAGQRRCDVVKRIVAQGFDGHVRTRTDVAAQLRGHVALEHQHAGAHADRRRAAARKAEGEEDNVVIGSGVRADVAAGAHDAAVADAGIKRLVVDHDHGGGAHARRAAGRDAAGDVV